MIPHNTIVQTDQGPILVHKLTTTHTIDMKSIVSILHGRTKEHLVRIEAHSLGYQYPDRPTMVTLSHKVYYNRRMIQAKHLINDTTITFVPYHGEILYHVLLEYHSTMRVNQLIIETLDPIKINM